MDAQDTYERTKAAPAVFRAYYDVIAYQLWMAERSYVLAVGHPSGFNIDPSPVFRPYVGEPTEQELKALLGMVELALEFFLERPMRRRSVEMVDGMIVCVEDLLRADQESGEEVLDEDLRKEFEEQREHFRAQRARLQTEEDAIRLRLENQKVKVVEAKIVLASRL